MPFKLGLLPALHDNRTLKLSKFLDRAKLLPSVPLVQNWSGKVQDFPMYRNDQIGDCGIAGPAHLHQVWTANDGVLQTPREADVIAAYSAIGGYVPGRPETDRGVYLLEVMKYWRLRGLFGQRIAAFASVDTRNPQEVMAAIYLFGGLIIGLNLPIAAQDAQTWVAPSRFTNFGRWAPGSWGGHCVHLADYDQNWLCCTTWGARKKLNWPFLHTYCSEAYCAISRAWLGPDNKAPNGFDSKTLASDLLQFTAV